MKCPKCGSEFVVVTDYDDNYFDCHDCGAEFCRTDKPEYNKLEEDINKEVK